jgi:hypothetical protein
VGEIVIALLLTLSAHAAGEATDADGDGFGRGEDCNDHDARMHPGATEICNGVNDDCDAATSESGMVSVGGDGYATIQDAVDAAPLGATVRICDGTWYENVEINRSVTLEGVGPARSIIDGSEANPVVSVQSRADVTLRGLTLQHGVGWSGGGGIFLSRVPGSLTVDDCVVRDNTGPSGGGLMGLRFRGDVLLTGSTFRGNTATDYGGGGAYLDTQFGNVVEIRECVFADNEAPYGGGLFIYGYAYRDLTGEARISDTLIDGNRTLKHRAYRGGGILSFALQLTLSGVTVSNNRGGTGAGVYASGDVIADEETLIASNRTWTGGWGGGLAVPGTSRATWTGGIFEGNSAERGGGVYLKMGSDLPGVGPELVGVVVRENRATDAGGGVYAWSGAKVIDSLITENVSDGVGGGIATEHRGRDDVLVRSSTITANVAAVSGGGAYLGMSLRSEACDWGEDATDNEPDDVAFSWDGSDVSYEDFGAAEDFVCDLTVGTCE